MKAINGRGTLNSNYLRYFIAGHKDNLLALWRKQGATVESIDSELMANTVVPVPPRGTQRAIANFLDEKTATIDDLIAKKERLIELLEEKRAALINRAVTKGLDPDVPMKDSGIGPIDKIPKHWDVVRNKVLFREYDDRSETGEEELLTVSHLTGVTPRSTKEVNMFMAESLEGYKRCEPGDFCVNTMWAWMGAVGFARQEGIISPSYHVYRSRDTRVLPEYFDLLFRSRPYVIEITRYSRGVWSSRLRLYPDSFLGDMCSPVPPRKEQEGIVRRVEQETGAYSDIIEKTSSSLETLREYRQSLITAAVTGQLDIEAADGEVT